MTETKHTGRLIAFEGIDGAGKATQARLLREALSGRGLSCDGTDFPRYEENLGGILLKECLSGKRGDFVNLDPMLASLPYAIDRFQSADRIRAALADGKIFIADRYVGSNQIHQGGKFDEDEERTAYLVWLDQLEHELLGNPRPDVVVYLKAPVEVSLQLLAKKRAAKNSHLGDGELDQVEQDRRYLDRSHAMAQWLAAREPNWHVIDCVDPEGEMRTEEEIHAEILALVDGLFR
ncbi:MAG TPA: thymidylate kinase [Candidatus Paceibacterota bacterium]